MIATAPTADFDTAYRRVWQVPTPLRVSEWAEQFRILSRRQSSRPGRWSNEAAPPLAGLMNLAVHPRVRKLSIMKAAQVGVSEAMRNVLGYLADREPDPVLLNLPSEAHGRGIFSDRIIPLFEDCPRLAELLSDSSRDTTLSQINCANGFTLRLGWSGSPTSQSSHPVRVVWNDEVDKFIPWAGIESDPISLAEVRTATYGNSIIIISSTPTRRDGPIYRQYDAAPIKLAFHAVCPHCRKFQPLRFDRLKYDHVDDADKNKRAASVLMRGAAWYVCEGCGVLLEDRERARMLAGGCWTNEDGSYRLHVDGTEHGELPNDCEIGAHLSAFHSLAPKHRLANIAAEFIKSLDDPMRMQNFRNSWLGEVFEIQTATTKTDVVRDKAASAAPPHIIPEWAVALIATADTQKDHFWFTIRAWGFEYKSQLIHYGMCVTFDELYRVCLNSSFAIAGRAGQVASPSALLIDTGGTRTSEVYQFALTDQRIIPCKGTSEIRMQRPWTLHPQPSGIVLRMLNVDYYKDLLHRLLNDPDSTRWMPHSQIAEDYAQQLTAEHKVFDRKRRREVWTVRTSGAANHLFDCEVLQCAAADMGNFGQMQQVVASVPSSAQPSQPHRESKNPLTAHRGKW
jgi:phage terminase large subunit GpA-like protein